MLEKGLFNRKGDNFANTTLNKMIKNITYTGILRNGDTQSEIFPELQIIDVGMFERAQEIMSSRTLAHSDVPLNTKSNALIAGLAYCAHCGSKLVLTTSGARGSNNRKARYGCHFRVRHPQSCDGQAGYGVVKLDALVEQTVKMLFERIKAMPREDLVQTQHETQIQVARLVLEQSTEKLNTKNKELELYKSEVKNAIAGTSSFGMDLLNELIAETKEQISVLETAIENAKAEINGYEQLSEIVSSRYDDVLSWADLFDGCSMEAKKMIVSQLIKQVRIGRDYDLQIDLNISYEMFCDVLKDVPTGLAE